MCQILAVEGGARDPKVQNLFQIGGLDNGTFVGSMLTRCNSSCCPLKSPPMPDGL